MSGLPFLKMHGLGNDFVVLDRRRHAFDLDAEAARRIADRRTGVGCDQVLILEPARNGQAARLTIRNADGGEATACGNGARCVAALLFEESGRPTVTIETAAGPVQALAKPGGQVEVDMGPAFSGWREIPLAREIADTSHLPVSAGPLSDPVGVGIGNPHAIFFMADAESIDLERWGPEVEQHPLFPMRTNVEVCTIRGRERIRMRVWERGVGVTRACGSGACAALVAAVRRGLAQRKAELILDGGSLEVEWRAEDGHVLLTGPVATSFSGSLDPSLLGSG
ncbi:MAG TPA: diaminopimelate epimerase [Alphaproteobacteria bacterium]|nr:diaminopimelate epimerase [Alphaproteobacteria bacterium]